MIDVFDEYIFRPDRKANVPLMAFADMTQQSKKRRLQGKNGANHVPGTYTSLEIV
jgi:hypothetical protein